MSWLSGVKYDRMIAIADRLCDRCEGTIPEGTVFGRTADERVCPECIDYEALRGRPNGRTAED